MRALPFFAALLTLPLASLQAQTTPAPQTTLRTQARLVVLDVVVTDKDKNPVHGLKTADFTVLESKDPQKIAAFEEHTALTPTQAAKFPPFPRLGPGLFTNYTAAPINSAVNILLLDSLNTPRADQAYVRAQIQQYLKNARPGTNVAIFGLTTKLLMLQGFTSNPEVLKSVVAKQSGQNSPLIDDAIGGGGPPTSITDQMMDFNGIVPAEVVARMQTFENESKSYQLQLRAKYTLDAMNQLAHFLAGIPGRKNLIWFSGSFPINILPDTSGQSSDPFAAVASSEQEYRETTNLLARSQVAVYPIDARGLMVSPTLSAANSGGQKYAHDPRAYARDESNFFAQTADEHSTMLRMAEDTGGHAFINTNGLTEAVAQAIDFGSNYYTLAYTPTNTRWQGDYRKIQVKLAQSGYTLAYRHGYYAEEPDSAFSAVTSTGAATTSPHHDQALMLRAMTHGAPPQTQILFKIRVLPATMEEEAKLLEGNIAIPGKISGPYRRYAVDFAADPSQILFTRTADDRYHATLEFVTLVYNAEGALVNSDTQEIPANLTAANYKELMRTGIPFHQEISVPVKGQYTLRIGLHDLRNNAIGVTELPVAAVKNLPPVPVPAKAPAPPPGP